MSQPNIAQMTQPGGIVPIDIETTAALVAEIKRQHAAIERKDALLSKCLKHVASNISMTSDGTEAEDLYDAITSELAKK